MSSLAYILNYQNLFLLDAESLVDQQVLDKLSGISQDPQFDLEPGEALDFYERLDTLVRNNMSSLQQNPVAYNQISAILWILSWKALSAMSAKSSKNILAKNLIDSIKLGIDVRKCLEKIVGPYEFRTGPEKETRRGWVYSLEHNQEKLGNKTIVLDSGTVQPLVENWLKSYNLSQPLTSARAKFNQINFLNNSKETDRLSVEDREVLKKILEVYDWLLFPPPGPVVVPDEDFDASASAMATPYVLREKFELPKEILQEPQIQPKPVAPVAPRPKAGPFPAEVPGGELRVAGGPSFAKATEGKQAEIDRTDTTDRTNKTYIPEKPAMVMRPLTVSPAKSDFAGTRPADGQFGAVNIQDVLKHQMEKQEKEAGLKMGDGEERLITNNKFQITNGRQTLNNQKPEPVNKAQEIDKKLEELKKKAGGGNT